MCIYIYIYIYWFSSLTEFLTKYSYFSYARAFDGGHNNNNNNNNNTKKKKNDNNDAIIISSSSSSGAVSMIMKYSYFSYARASYVSCYSVLVYVLV